MKKSKILYNTQKYNMANIFCFFSLIGLFITVVTLFATHGEMLSKIFFYDEFDTGMDFFHSIEYVRGRVPYERWQTLYPPLANFSFLILYQFVPHRVSNQWPNTFLESLSLKKTENDVRLTQSMALLFNLFILITAIIIMAVIQIYLKYSTQSFLIGTMVILSYGMLYAYERGNIIIVSFFCCMIFVFFKDSPNKIISEFALISLAIAAGLKLYPAFLGFLLLYDKQTAKALRTILYGIIFFVAPVFIFHEGVQGIGMFLEILFTNMNIDTLTKAAEGFSLTQIISSLVLLLQNITGISVNETFWLKLLPMISLMFSATLLLCGFKLKMEWQKVLVCCTAMLLCSFQYNYVLIFLAIPLLVMIKEEENLNKRNIVPFSFLVFSQILLPITRDVVGVWRLIDLRFQICLIVFVVCIICELFEKKIKSRKSQ